MVADGAMPNPPWTSASRDVPVAAGPLTAVVSAKILVAVVSRSLKR
ncbi:hypothetical protein AB0C11_13005 [Streptomyces sp. NPDC039016]